MFGKIPLKKMIETKTGKKYSDSEFQNVLEEHFTNCASEYCEEYGFLSPQNFLIEINHAKNGRKLLAIGKSENGGENFENPFTFFEFMNMTGDIPPIVWKPLRRKVFEFEGQLIDFFKSEGLTCVCYIGKSGEIDCFLANTYKNGTLIAEGVRLTEILMNEI